MQKRQSHGGTYFVLQRKPPVVALRSTEAVARAAYFRANTQSGTSIHEILVAPLRGTESSRSSHNAAVVQRKTQNVRT